MGFLNNLLHANDLKVVNLQVPQGIDLDLPAATVNLTLQGGDQDRTVSTILIELVRLTEERVRDESYNGGFGHMRTETHRVVIRRHLFDNAGQPWYVPTGSTLPLSLTMDLTPPGSVSSLLGSHDDIDAGEHPFLAAVQRFAAPNMSTARFELVATANVEGIMLDPNAKIDVAVRNVSISGY